MITQLTKRASAQPPSRRPADLFADLAPDGTPCKGDTRGLLKRYPITASGFRLIGKETERGWEQDDDISTLLPSLMQYDNHSLAGEQLRQRLLQVPLDVLARNRFKPPHNSQSAPGSTGAPEIA